jgi:hypothetical protein
MAAHHTSVTFCNVIIERDGYLLRDHGRMFSVIAARITIDRLV